MVGDGTTAQLCAMLTGTAEHELPEARRHVVGGTFVDRWPFIFDELHRAGYQTVYTEDDPSKSAFQYRLHGFKVGDYAIIIFQLPRYLPTYLIAG